MNDELRLGMAVVSFQLLVFRKRMPPKTEKLKN